VSEPGAATGDAPDAAPWTAIAIHRDDNVAVALADLAAGVQAAVRRDGEIVPVAVVEPIPCGHKLALAAIAPGAVLRKYGEPIGVATAPIARGAHVHVHNLASLRVRSGT
jgi:altronate dehydratase